MASSESVQVVIVSDVRNWCGPRHGRPNVPPWRVAPNAAEGLTGGAPGLVPKGLRDGEEAVTGFLQAFASQKPALTTSFTA